MISNFATFARSDCRDCNSTLHALMPVSFIIALTITANDQPEISAIANKGAGEIVAGETVEVEVALTNRGSTNLIVEEITALGNLQIKVTNAKKQVLQLTNYGRTLGGDSFHTNAKEIKPGRSIESIVNLSRIFDLSLPGNYSIDLKYLLPKDKAVDCSIALDIVDPFVSAHRKKREAEIDEQRAARAEMQIPRGRDVAFTDPRQDSPHTITVKSSVEKITLGSSPFIISYLNTGTSNWELVKPDSARRMVVHYAATRQPEAQGRYAPNGPYLTVARTSNLQKFLVGGREPKIEIKPGESVTCALDIYSVPNDWRPAQYELWIHNDAENVGSNKIKFRLEVNADTVGLLLDMAEFEFVGRDVIEKRHREVRRDFAINWLIKTFPDLPLNPITDRDDQNVVNAKYEQNHRFIADFRAKWATRKDSPEIRALFEKLNAGK